MPEQKGYSIRFDGNEDWYGRNLSSQQVAEAYAIEKVINHLDENPNAKAEIIGPDGNVVKTYTAADVQQYIDKRYENVARPRDEYGHYWDLRKERLPSGAPAYTDTTTGEEAKQAKYKPGDIVEVHIGQYETGWYEMQQKEKPATGYLTYEKALRYLEKGRNPEYRKIDRNTWVEKRDDDSIALRLHNTDIATFHADGTFDVYIGGWNSMTTNARLHQFVGVRLEGIDAGRGSNKPLKLNGVPIGSFDIVKFDGSRQPIMIKKEGSNNWEKIDTKILEKEKYKGREINVRPGELAEIAYVDDKRSRTGWQGIVYALIYLSDGEKGFVKQDSLVPVKTTPEFEGEEISLAQLKNDTFSNETETPSASTKDEGRTLEVIDKTQNVKNKIPGPWDGTTRVAKNPFYARAQTDHETAETGHIGSNEADGKLGKTQRAPGNMSEPLYPSMHETDTNSTSKQL